MARSVGRSSFVASRARLGLSILLDTHYVYALAGAPGRLRDAERAFLTANDDGFYVSAVAVWEMRLKWNALFASGQRKGPIGPEQAMRALRGQPLNFLPLEPAHAAMSLDTPLAHKDPFDELLLVQAQAYGLKMFTRDARLKHHPLAVFA